MSDVIADRIGTCIAVLGGHDDLRHTRDRRLDIFDKLLILCFFKLYVIRSAGVERYREYILGGIHTTDISIDGKRFELGVARNHYREVNRVGRRVDAVLCLHKDRSGLVRLAEGGCNYLVIHHTDREDVRYNSGTHRQLNRIVERIRTELEHLLAVNINLLERRERTLHARVLYYISRRVVTVFSQHTDMLLIIGSVDNHHFLILVSFRCRFYCRQCHTVVDVERTVVEVRRLESKRIALHLEVSEQRIVELREQVLNGIVHGIHVLRLYGNTPFAFRELSEEDYLCVLFRFVAQRRIVLTGSQRISIGMDSRVEAVDKHAVSIDRLERVIGRDSLRKDDVIDRFVSAVVRIGNDDVRRYGCLCIFPQHLCLRIRRNPGYGR